MPHLPRYWRAFRLIKSLETCVNLGQLQEDIFQCLGKDLVNNTLIGYNSTIFSYGYVYAYVYMYNAHRPKWHDLLVRVHACHEVSDLARKSTLFDLDRASHCDSRRYGQTGAGKTYSMIGEASTLPYSSAYTRRGLSLVF